MYQQLSAKAFKKLTCWLLRAVNLKNKAVSYTVVVGIHNCLIKCTKNILLFIVPCECEKHCNLETSNPYLAIFACTEGAHPPTTTNSN